MSNAALSPVIQSLVISPTQLSLDHEMVAFDIWGTRAHVVMLAECAIIDRERAAAILHALEQIELSYRRGEFIIDAECGAQLSLEQAIVAITGEHAGLSAHTARSRNDQVMVTELLYLRCKSCELLSEIVNLANAFLALSSRHLTTVMPGYTHMQPGKPTTFAHWCLAYHDALMRGARSVLEVLNRYDRCPLGAVESFGTSWPIDRELTRKLLGFAEVWEVPQDAISSRGMFQLELLSALTCLGITGSKFASDLLLYTTFEFGTVTLGDKVAKRLHPVTGSSVMPQKRNPDALELIRTVAPQIAGCFTTVAGILSSLPSGYNRDQREVKEYIQAGLNKAGTMVSAMKEVLDALEVNTARMTELVVRNYSLTTELADCIAQKFGLPYRKVYKVVGQAVDEIITKGKFLGDLTSEDLKQHAQAHELRIELSQSELAAILDPHAALSRRKHIGGTNRECTGNLIARRHDETKLFMRELDDRQGRIKSARDKTLDLARKYRNFA